jgi:glycosyltransferase involved in cell wall biosynthesis
MRGYWADERVEGGLWDLKVPVYLAIYKYFKIKEREFLKHADHVVSLTQNSRSEIYSRNVRRGPISVIPTCVDLGHFNPEAIKGEQKDALKKRLGLNDEFVLLYLGSWGTWYLGNEMLKFFESIKRLDPRAKLLIVTTDKVEKEKLWFKDDIIITEATREEVPVYISIASASLFFIKPSFSKKGTYATKMGELMAMNIPIITNPGWGDAEIIVKEAGGFLNTDENVFSLVLANQGIKTRQYCVDNLSLQYGVLKYNEIYESLKSSSQSIRNKKN